jgi:hypothetical protein
VYRILTDDEVMEQVAALPVELFPYYAQVLDLLELSPWTGEPYHPGKPAAPMRRLPFGPGGRGEVIYLVLEDRQRVDLLRVYWL